MIDCFVNLSFLFVSTVADTSTGNEYSRGKDNYDDVKKEKLASNDGEYVDDVDESASEPEVNFRKRETFSITYQQAKIRQGKYMSSNNISHID